MVISRTPFRISFFGGGTDYPAWYKEHNGSVLATTINKYCYILCRFLPPFFDYKYRVVYSKAEMVQSISELHHPSMRNILKLLKIREGIELHHDGDLPARTGLGSSSSFTVGCLNACYALKGNMTSREQLAREAIYVEQELNKENVGSQDQYAVALGGLNRLDFSGNHVVIPTPIILDEEISKVFHSHLMLVFTGFSRIASEIVAHQLTNIHKNKRSLKVMQGMVDEAINILLKPRRIESFGKLLHESWKLKRSLSQKVSTPEIDNIYSAARSAGALGGKILGAGGGGFMLLFASPDRHQRIRNKLKHLLHIPFEFENFGSQIIFYSSNQKERREWTRYK